MNGKRERWSRRRFMGGLTVAGAAALSGVGARNAVAEPPPETTRIKLPKYESICVAPQYVAEELLKAEGFTEATYVSMRVADQMPALASG
jgi:NitT/TauT family transport system substrate-binding protein